MELAVHDFGGERGGVPNAELFRGVQVHLVQKVGHIGLELPNGIGVGGVEGERDHGLHSGEVNFNEGVVVRTLRRSLRLELIPTAQNIQVLPGDIIGGPNGGEAGCLRGHDVDAGAVIHGEALHTGAEELQNGIFDNALPEGGADQGQRHVLRTGAGTRRAGEMDCDDLGIGDIVGLFQKLAGQLRAALADGYGTVSTVAGVGVGAQDHPSGGGVPLPHIGVNDRLMGGDKFAAVLLGGGEAENMVVLIDGTAHGTQRIVTVGEHVGQGKGGEAGSPGRLDDAHVGDIVGGHGVEFDLQPFRVAGGVVRPEDGGGHGAGPLRRRPGMGGDEASALIKYGGIGDLDHSFGYLHRGPWCTKANAAFA